MITAQLRGRDFQFETKPGLFSKDQVDSGSRLLIDSVEIHPNDTVLDIGCGYGVVGLVIASLANKVKVYMVDTDIRAIKYSKINATLNKIDNVEIIASDGFEELPNVKFDIVVSNPPSHLPKETMIEFIEDSKKQLKADGKLYFVNEKRIKLLIKREFMRVFGNHQVVAENSVYVISVAKQS